MDIAMSGVLTWLLTLQPVRLVVHWVWRSHHVRATSDVSPARWEQSTPCCERSWPWGLAFVMGNSFLDSRWDEVLSILCLASPWLSSLISSSTVVSRPYKPTRWFYLHRSPGGIKRWADMGKEAGFPLNPTKWGGKCTLQHTKKIMCITTPKSSNTQVSSTEEKSTYLPEKNWRINGKAVRFKLTYCPTWYFCSSCICSGGTWWCVSG